MRGRTIVRAKLAPQKVQIYPLRDGLSLSKFVRTTTTQPRASGPEPAYPPRVANHLMRLRPSEHTQPRLGPERGG